MTPTTTQVSYAITCFIKREDDQQRKRKKNIIRDIVLQKKDRLRVAFYSKKRIKGHF